MPIHEALDAYKGLSQFKYEAFLQGSYKRSSSRCQECGIRGVEYASQILYCVSLAPGAILSVLVTGRVLVPQGEIR